MILLWRQGAGVPRSVLILNPLLLTLFMAAGRITYRWWKTERPANAEHATAESVLLLTEGELSLSLLYEIQRSPNYNLIGILTRDSGNIGRSITGIPVVGLWGELDIIARRMGASRVILSDKGLDHESRRHAFALCEAARTKLMLLPDVDDLVSGRLRYSELREVELDDLLGRDPVHLDTKGLSYLIGDKIVLVTGAGGSIGSELCRQIARFNPGLLVMFEQNEFALYNAEQEFARRFPNIPISCVMGWTRNSRAI